MTAQVCPATGEALKVERCQACQLHPECPAWSGSGEREATMAAGRGGDTALARNLGSVVTAVFLTLGGGGGIYASHTAVAAKLDEVLAGQHKLELSVGKLESQNSAEKLQDMDARVRALEAQVARLGALTK